MGVIGVDGIGVIDGIGVDGIGVIDGIGCVDGVGVMGTAGVADRTVGLTSFASTEAADNAIAAVIKNGEIFFKDVIIFFANLGG